MPIYEYRCSKCDTVFELIQRFSDAPLTVHEGCGGAVERLISVSGLHFKGTGFYITDYKNAGAEGGKTEGGKTETGKTESGDGGKAESKPAETKTESKPAETKPAGTKPAGTKTESKPAETSKKS
jgi:putative FmdB family regulatory protein